VLFGPVIGLPRALPMRRTCSPGAASLSVGKAFDTGSTDLARLTLPEVRAEDDPDAALIAWLDHEKALFRRLERKVVSSRIEAGFVNDTGTDFDGFISFSLSVQNRRKSRMGHSLENHLAAILRAHDIRHVRGCCHRT